ncbi:VanW family protein [Pseudanabaena mucicola]|uniref:VanW family protein n=1 Tax=Pseudanabaena mucicola FACHB-723 TaxID=2692860 RepID=A0ABR7ZTI4_9CYAN|nr:VanW family protein [Pseudanabaena mucicola]MBD2187294.1 VanW family protein [Pseudanabaena mucicola FACHB-723]
MQKIWQNLKTPIRNTIKYTKALAKGYPFHYARHQQPHQADQYLHKWIEFETPIPDRGTSEIRANRIWNLQLAAQKINFLNLPPNKIFGFSDRIGAPTKANGFREAPVFVRGQVLTDAGGGLCLVATNLFNTLLYGGCEILERHCHSIDAYGESRFYTLGQDAAVAHGYKDLIVRNQSHIPLQIRFRILAEDGKVESSLWGTAPRPWQIKVASQVCEQIHPPTPEYLSGWVVKTVRYIQPNDAKPEVWQQDYAAMSRYAPCVKS